MFGISHDRKRPAGGFYYINWVCKRLYHRRIVSEIEFIRYDFLIRRSVKANRYYQLIADSHCNSAGGISSRNRETTL